jgi:hypothetical protein
VHAGFAGGWPEKLDAGVEPFRDAMVGLRSRRRAQRRPSGPRGTTGRAGFSTKEITCARRSGLQCTLRSAPTASAAGVARPQVGLRLGYGHRGRWITGGEAELNRRKSRRPTSKGLSTSHADRTTVQVEDKTVNLSPGMAVRNAVSSSATSSRPSAIPAGKPQGAVRYHPHGGQALRRDFGQWVLVSSSDGFSTRCARGENHGRLGSRLRY